MNYIKSFTPLESDPGIFTQLMHDLGVSQNLKFVDIPTLDDSYVQHIPGLTLALILVLPPCPAYKREQTAKQTCSSNDDEGPVWLKQTIDNACGLYAILHAVCNIANVVEKESVLDDFWSAPDRRSFLEKSKTIEYLYARAAQKGASDFLFTETEVEHHYICLIKHSGRLYMLDGEMDGPIVKGALEEDDDFVVEGLKVVREYTESNTDGTFSLLALITAE